jgi:glucose-6-phosphate 1-dehydrogenase
MIDSWRWDGVPWYLRSGKYLPETASEILVELKPPPQRLFADAAAAPGKGNYFRFRASPDAAIALAARVKLAGEEFIGEQRELYLLEQQPGEESPYERLLGDAMKGDGDVYSRRRSGSRMDGCRSGPQAPSPRSPLQARHVGAETGGRLDCSRRRLA